MCEKSNKVVILQPEFLPWIGLFEQIALADVYIHYDDVQLSSNNRSRTNKTKIKLPNGLFQITAPLKRIKEQKIMDVHFDNLQAWQAKHRKNFDLAFKKAPFYSEARNLFERIYAHEEDSLCEFNIFAIEEIARYFDLETIFLRSSSMHNSELKSTERLVDICQKLEATHYITGWGAKSYIDYDLFEKNDIKIEFMDYKLTPYPQLFCEFNPYLSIFDLIANCGRDGKKYIQSESVYWKNIIKEH